GQVLFDQDRGNRENVPDIVKAISGIIYRKIVGGSKVNSQEVPHRVVVFSPVETPHGDPSRIRLVTSVVSFDLLVHPPGSGLNRILSRTRKGRGRHLPGPDLAPGELPHMAFGEGG